MSLGLPERIEAEISPEPNSGCWLWFGDTAPNGYGRTRIAGRREGVHRFSYRFFCGEIPEGKQLDHLCRIRCCVNPQHLEPVTIEENVARGVSFSAANSAKTHCVKGHPFSGGNLYVNKRGHRVCRACSRIVALAGYHRRKKLKT